MIIEEKKNEARNQLKIWVRNNFINIEDNDLQKFDEIVNTYYDLFLENVYKIGEIQTLGMLLGYLKRKKEEQDRQDAEWQQQCKEMNTCVISQNNENNGWNPPTEDQKNNTLSIIEQYQKNLLEEPKNENGETIIKKSLFTLKGKRDDDIYDDSETARRLECLDRIKKGENIEKWW